MYRQLRLLRYHLQNKQHGLASTSQRCQKPQSLSAVELLQGLDFSGSGHRAGKYGGKRSAPLEHRRAQTRTKPFRNYSVEEYDDPAEERHDAPQQEPKAEQLISDEKLMQGLALGSAGDSSAVYSFTDQEREACLAQYLKISGENNRCAKEVREEILSLACFARNVRDARKTGQRGMGNLRHFIDGQVMQLCVQENILSLGRRYFDVLCSEDRPHFMFLSSMVSLCCNNSNSDDLPPNQFADLLTLLLEQDDCFVKLSSTLIFKVTSLTDKWRECFDKLRERREHIDQSVTPTLYEYLIAAILRHAENIDDINLAFDYMEEMAGPDLAFEPDTVDLARRHYAEVPRAMARFFSEGRAELAMELLKKFSESLRKFDVLVDDDEAKAIASVLSMHGWNAEITTFPVGARCESCKKHQVEHVELTAGEMAELRGVAEQTVTESDRGIWDRGGMDEFRRRFKNGKKYDLVIDGCSTYYCGPKQFGRLSDLFNRVIYSTRGAIHQFGFKTPLLVARQHMFRGNSTNEAFISRMKRELSSLAEIHTSNDTHDDDLYIIYAAIMSNAKILSRDFYRDFLRARVPLKHHRLFKRWITGALVSIVTLNTRSGEVGFRAPKARPVSIQLSGDHIHIAYKTGIPPKVVKMYEKGVLGINHFEPCQWICLSKKS